MTFSYDDKGKFFTDVISKVPVDALVQTTTHLIKGVIHVRHDERVKDELGKVEDFLALTNVEVLDSEGKTLYTNDFLAIQVSQIVWVLPKEEISEEREQDA